MLHSVLPRLPLPQHKTPGIMSSVFLIKPNILLYVDGVLAASNVYNFNIWSSTSTLDIGNDELSLSGFIGTIDEVRFSNNHRSADWIHTSYNNQSSPSTFYTLGSEIGAATVTTNTASNIAGTTATVNGTLTFDGGKACQYQFEYGTVSGGPYGSNTGWTGSINFRRAIQRRSYRPYQRPDVLFPR